ADVRMGDPAFYIFTSGTTGLPKASIMSHHRWVGAGLLFGDLLLGLSPRDTIYAPLPLYHNQALTMCWSSCVRTGAALAIPSKFSASSFWDDCRRYQATVVAYIGEIARYLLAQPPSEGERRHRVRKAVGVGMRADLWTRFKERFGIDEVYEFYSASELNAGFFNLLNLDKTVGVCPAPWALVAYDPETGAPKRDVGGRLKKLGVGEAGLLLTKVTPRFRFEGYTDAEATRNKVFADVFEPGDEWVNTGDLMRSLGFGHLQFVDRVGDTFRWKGENVATTEVEAVAAGEPTIADVTVYGVQVPEALGRAGMMAVVPSRSQVDRDALLARLCRELPAYAIPVFLRESRELEVTGTFKHIKHRLRDDGFDPSIVSDPLFVRLPGSNHYEPLTEGLHRQITAREVGF
ncbi:MAG: citronellyl-CoA synthetase, partial [Myxococcota bacterium]